MCSAEYRRCWPGYWRVHRSLSSTGHDVGYCRMALARADKTGDERCLFVPFNRYKARTPLFVVRSA